MVGATPVAAFAVSDPLVKLSVALVLVVIVILVLVGRGIYDLLSGLVVAIGFIVPMDSLRVGPIGGLADALLLSTLPLLFLDRIITSRRWRLGYLPPVMLAAGGVAFGGLVGTFWSVAVDESVLNILRFTVGVGGTLLVLALVPRSIIDVRRYAWAFVLGATVSAAYGFTNFNVYNGRSPGLAVHPNTMGIVSAFAVSVLWGLLVTASRIGRLVGALCVAVLSAGVFNSGSRAGLLALVASTVMFLIFTQNARMLRHGAAILVAALLAIAAGLYTLPPSSAIDRLTNPSLAADSNKGRALIREQALARIKAHGLTGAGFASATAAHSVPLQLIDSAGVIGGLSGLVMAIMVIRPMVRHRCDPLVGAFLAMYISYLAAALVANAIWDRWLWFPIACGLAAVVHREGRMIEPAFWGPADLPPADLPSSIRSP